MQQMAKHVAVTVMLTMCNLSLVLQTVAHARMEQQLYGSSSRTREEDARVINGKARSIGGAFEDDNTNGRRKRRSDEGTRRSKSGSERQGLRGLFFNILRSRFDSNGGSGGSSGGFDSPKSIESQLVRREGSMHVSPCPVQS